MAAIHFLRDTGKKIIDERRKAIRNGDDIPSDILTYILKSVDQDASVDYEELLDHFVTFFIAGKLRSISLISSGTWSILRFFMEYGIYCILFIMGREFP